jgi:hypothetical protein
MAKSTDASLYERDCLALLSYVAANRDEFLEGRQTQWGLARACGMTQSRLWDIISSVKEWGMNSSVLWRTAAHYGYDFKLANEKGRVIDVVYRGRTYR